MSDRKALLTDMKTREEQFNHDCDVYLHNNTNDSFVRNFKDNVSVLIDLWKGFHTLVSSQKYFEENTIGLSEEEKSDYRNYISNDIAVANAMINRYVFWYNKANHRLAYNNGLTNIKP